MVSGGRVPLESFGDFFLVLIVLCRHLGHISHLFLGWWKSSIARSLVSVEDFEGKNNTCVA